MSLRHPGNAVGNRKDGLWCVLRACEVVAVCGVRCVARCAVQVRAVRCVRDMCATEKNTESDATEKYRK